MHPAALLLPGPQEAVTVQLDARTLAEIAPLLRLPGVRLTITADRHLAVALPNGGLLVFPAADPVVQALGDATTPLLARLIRNPDAVLDILSNPEDAVVKLAALRDTEPDKPETLPERPSEDRTGGSEGDSQPPESQSGFKGLFVPKGLGDALGSSAPIGLHGPRWGRDDLKRGEIGEQGEYIVATVGSSIDHMIGLADEDPGSRNGEKLENSDNTRIQYAAMPIGSTFGHLGTLGDTEYWKSSGDQVYGADDRGPTIYAPLIRGPLAFSLVEDHAFGDRLFAGNLLGSLQIRDIVTAMDPAQGTVTLLPNGSFDYTPAPGYSGQASFTFSFTDPRTTLKVSGTVDLTVEAVADPVTIAGAASGDEDSAIALPVSIDLQDPDGSETIESVVVTGVPSGAVLDWNHALPGTVTGDGTGGFTVTGTEAEIRAIVASLTLTPPLHYSGTITLGLAVTSIEAFADPLVPGYRDRETTHASYVVEVVPVADTPPSAAAGPYTTDEDVAVALPGLAGSLVDTDSSEVLTFRITGVPAGASFDKGTDLGGGVWAFSPADIAAGLTFLPPPNANGTYPMVLVAIATEQANGDVAQSTAPFRVIVAPVADHVDVTTSPAQGPEDTTILFGDKIGIAINDTDASEVLTGIAITGVPTGAVLGWNTGIAGGSVTSLGGGSYQISGSETAIRALLASMTIVPPLHDATDIALTIKITTTDAGGPTNTETIVQPIVVTPVADVPTAVGGTFSTEEDITVALTGVGGALVDADSSEALTFRITGVPVGASFNVGTNLGGGVWSFTPAQMAGGLSFTPPANAHGTYDMTLISTATETENNDAAQNSAPIRVVVDAQADAPTVTTTAASGVEDTAILFGNNLSITLNDTDGSERVNQVTISSLPTGSSLSCGSGPYVITGTEAQIRALLATFAYTPPHNDDSNVSLSVAVRTTDADGSTATTTIGQPIVVSADADVPSGSGSASGTEDTIIAVPITVGLADTDGSETIHYVDVTGVPAGATVSWTSSLGTVTAITGGFRVELTGATFSAGTNAGGGVWTFTAAQIASGISFTPPSNAHGTYNMTLVSIATEGENSDVAQNTAPITVVVDSQADGVTLAAGNASGNEDQSFLFGDKITWTKIDNDGSEAVTQVQIAQVPTGWAVTYTASGAAAVSATSDGFIVTGTEAEIRATLNTFRIQAPLHRDEDTTLQVTVTTTDADGSTKAASASQAIKVNAVADVPNVDGGSYTTDEDTAVALTGIGGALVDADGSETLTFRISNVPTGGSFNVGTNAGGGVWTFTAAQVAGGISFNPPAQVYGTYDMTLRATATEHTVAGESTADDVATKDATITVVVAPVLDVPTIGTSSSTVNEDTQFNLGQNIGVAIADTDGSQSLSVTPAPTWTNSGGVTVTNNGGGSYTIAGANAANVLTVLNSFRMTPPKNTDANFQVGVSVTTVESGGASTTVTGTHSVVVRAVADAPTVSFGSPTGNEDTPIAVPITVSLNDTDGSETLQRVVVRGFPAPGPGSYFTLVDGFGGVAFLMDHNGGFNGTDALGNSYTVTGNGSGQFTFTGTTEGIERAGHRSPSARRSHRQRLHADRGRHGDRSSIPPRRAAKFRHSRRPGRRRSRSTSSRSPTT